MLRRSTKFEDGIHIIPHISQLSDLDPVCRKHVKMYAITEKFLKNRFFEALVSIYNLPIFLKIIKIVQYISKSNLTSGLNLVHELWEDHCFVSYFDDLAYP